MHDAYRHVYAHTHTHARSHEYLFLYQKHIAQVIVTRILDHITTRARACVCVREREREVLIRGGAIKFREGARYGQLEIIPCYIPVNLFHF